MKKYILAIILGTLAGILVQWALDSFAMGSTKYFLQLALKSLLIPILVIFVVQVMNTRKKA
jgi:heme exporter protein D